MVITGTFSFNMLANPSLANIRVTELPESVIKAMEQQIVSHIGYPTTALMLTNCLGFTIEANRSPIQLKANDCCIHAMTLNSPGQRVETIDQVNLLQPGKDYSFRYYLVEVL
jgi:hypothetical protein